MAAAELDDLTRTVQANGLNDKDYQTYYGGKVINCRASVFGYVFPNEEGRVQALEREYMANPNTRKPVFSTPPKPIYISPPLPESFRISCNRPQHGDEYYNKPRILSDSFNTHPANTNCKIRVR